MSAAERLERIAPRIPVFSPVIASGITRCWMTNLSTGGMGLIGLFENASVPQRGDDLEIEFGLGSDATPIRAVARIAWTSRLHAGRLGFGVQFRELSAQGRTQLAMFLAEHRPRVVVACASPAERELVEDCLGGLRLELVDDIADLDTELLRGSASILLFANRVDDVTSFLATLHDTRSGMRIGIELPFASVTLVTALASAQVLPLFAAERFSEVLRSPVDRAALVHAIERSCERWALELELRWASLQLEGLATPPPRPKPTSIVPPPIRTSVIRASDEMKRVYDLIQTVAVHDVPVLLTGETGTGKELAAREIHALSRRADTPFIAQDCGALTETLLESELFGHVRGAFTGATTDHPGLFQIADGGTIFLDEIQNTSPALQAKLLRVVEEGEVRPVGGAKPRRVDVRLIAACNVDLKEAVAQRLFRADFYYRLNRFPIALPPLREHTDDILALARYFAQTLCATLGRPEQRIEPRVEAALRAYPWPGNIRELKNTIERALLLTKPNDPLRWDTLPEEVRAGAASQPLDLRSFEAKVAEFERNLIMRALERNGGVVRRAAKDLEINAVTLARKMRRLGLGTSSD